MVLDVRFFNKNITLSKNKMNIFVINVGAEYGPDTNQ
jgi:hypothetical protein